MLQGLKERHSLKGNRRSERFHVTSRRGGSSCLCGDMQSAPPSPGRRGLKLPEVRDRTFCSQSKGNTWREYVVYTGRKMLYFGAHGVLRKTAGEEMAQENRGQSLEDHRSNEVKIPVLANIPSIEMWQTHKHINFKARRDVKEGTFSLLFVQRLGIWVKFKNWDEIQGSYHLLNTMLFPSSQVSAPGHRSNQYR